MELPWNRRAKCQECPYKLGLIQTAVNPCPSCKANGYQMYEWFRRAHSGAEAPPDKSK